MNSINHLNCAQYDYDGLDYRRKRMLPLFVLLLFESLHTAHNQCRYTRDMVIVSVIWIVNNHTHAMIAKLLATKFGAAAAAAPLSINITGCADIKSMREVGLLQLVPVYFHN